MITMGDYWKEEMVQQATALFLEFKDVFAWSYKDLKGIPPDLGEHKIELMEGAKPMRQRPYHMNPKYKEQVKTRLDKLLEATYILK